MKTAIIITAIAFLVIIVFNFIILRRERKRVDPPYQEFTKPVTIVFGGSMRELDRWQENQLGRPRRFTGRVEINGETHFLIDTSHPGMNMDLCGTNVYDPRRTKVVMLAGWSRGILDNVKHVKNILEIRKEHRDE